MKIIDPMVHKQKRLLLRDAQLNLDLVRLIIERQRRGRPSAFPWDDKLISRMLGKSFEFKERKYLSLLEKEQLHNEVKQMVASQEAKRPKFVLSGLPQFSELPKELRLMIWRYVFIVLEPHYMQSRTHCIEYSKRTGRFVSNQEKSPLWLICAESRECYIEETKTEFAFGTNINFQRDIVYFRKFFGRHSQRNLLDLEYQEVELELVDMFAELPFHDEDINDDPDAEQVEGASQSLGNSDDDEEEEEDVLFLPSVGDVKQAFLSFLSSPSASNIQRLALTSTCFTQLVFSLRTHGQMGRLLPQLKEILVVFDDYKRSRLKCWLDVTSGFRDLSAREKRKGGHRGYARWIARISFFGHKFQTSEDKIRWVVVEKGHKNEWNRRFMVYYQRREREERKAEKRKYEDAFRP
jgi:hypothetical protein